DIVVAGGLESMSRAPYPLPGARSVYRLGDAKVVDSMMYDGLWDQFDQVAMGVSTEAYCIKEPTSISREEQDDVAAKSHQRAAAAQENGLFADEIVPVEVPQRRGDPITVSVDEGVRGDTTAESLAKLRPAFSREDSATITAGNASQISDGGAALIMMSKKKAEE